MVLWSSGMRLAAFLLLYLASLLGTGIGVGIGNHPLQIPLIQSLSGTGFLPGDPFVATLPSYASPLWHLVALPARLVPWEPLLVVLFLLERAFVMYAFGRLAGALAAWARRRLRRRSPSREVRGEGGGPHPTSESKFRTLAVVAGWAFAALTPRPLVGDGTMVANYFEHTGVAIALIALSATALIELRVWRFGLLLGLAFDCNILYGIFAVAYFVPMIWLQRRELPLRQAARGLALALLLALPAVFMVVAGRGGATADAAGWVSVLRAYYPEHFFPVNLGTGGAPATRPAGDFDRRARADRTPPAAGVVVAVAQLDGGVRFLAGAERRQRALSPDSPAVHPPPGPGRRSGNGPAGPGGDCGSRGRRRNGRLARPQADGGRGAHRIAVAVFRVVCACGRHGRAGRGQPRARARTDGARARLARRHAQGRTRHRHRPWSRASWLSTCRCWPGPAA